MIERKYLWKTQANNFQQQHYVSSILLSLKPCLSEGRGNLKIDILLFTTHAWMIDVFMDWMSFNF